MAIWNFVSETSSLSDIGRTALERSSSKILSYDFNADTGNFGVYRGNGINNTLFFSFNLYDNNELTWRYYVGDENVAELKALRDYGLNHVGDGIYVYTNSFEPSKGGDSISIKDMGVISNSHPYYNENGIYKNIIFDNIQNYFDGKGFSYDNRSQFIYGDNTIATHTRTPFYTDVLIGAKGDDTILALLGNDKAYGDDGNDDIYGGYGDDILFGQSGNDNLYGEQNSDSLNGAAGNDVLDGGLGADTMVGGSGNDVYYVDNRKDVIIDGGSPADDDTVLIPVFLRYQLPKNVEDATLQGTDDSDLTGNSSGNELTGNDGDNQLNGSTGKDTLTGGAGNDEFIFDTTAKPTNVDKIEDFSTVDDQILLDNSIFKGIGGNGNLGSAAFNIGNSAEDQSDRIIYNPNTGNLYFDKDGAGSADQILIAKVDSISDLSARDFEII